MRERVHVALLVVITALAITHQATLWKWYVEDAAISFAFARHLADGEGLVAYAGGERVEGYSNPTWVALLAILALLGAQLFQAAKWTQIVLCALTVPLTYLTARAAMRRDDSDVPILAAAALAASSQFAIWGACGLENGLFSFFMALGLWRTTVELREGGTPWSALVWFLLAISRPEALMYAGIAGFFTMVFHWHAGRGAGPTVRWLAMFWVPYLGYHAARFAYFAWELPNTFYAKIGDHREPKPLNWQGHGWRYVRNWARTMGQGWLVPLYLLAMAGSDGRRVMGAMSVALVLAMAVLLPADQRILLPVVLAFTLLCYQGLVASQPVTTRRMATAAGLVLTGGFIAFAEYQRSRGAESTLPSPTWLPTVTSWLFAAVALLWPLVDLKQRGSQLRILCWTMCTGGLLFAISVHGDWMNGWRWLSLVSVPMAILLATGIEAAAEVVTDFWEPVQPRVLAVAVMVVLAIAPVPANVSFTQGFINKPVTGPFSVRARVHYKNKVKSQLHHYGPLVDLDVDQGAHLWWATDHQMLDIAGLVDVPSAQHKFHATFINQYVLKEQRPLFAHLHGGWATTSGITRLPDFKRDYFEIPGYPAGEKYHIGNFIRRDAVFEPAWSGPVASPIPFGDLFTVHGWSIPSPEAARDRRFYIELGVSMRRPLRRDQSFRMLMFLSDATGKHVATWDLPPAYDWITQDKWRKDEIFHGRFSPQLPPSLPPGIYDVGLVLIGADRTVLPAQPGFDPEDPALQPLPEDVVLGGVGTWPARVARGELRIVGALEVVSIAKMEELSNADLAAAHTHAEQGRCEQAEHAWFQSRSHRPRATPFFEEQGPALHTAIARCWALHAEAQPHLRLTGLQRARHWDHTQDDLVRVAAPTVVELMDTGAQAWADEDWETAFHSWNDALTLEPHRAWARRSAEQARTRWLQLDVEAPVQAGRGLLRPMGPGGPSKMLTPPAEEAP